MKTTLQILALIIVSPLMILAGAMFLVIWLPVALLEFGMELFDR